MKTQFVKAAVAALFGCSMMMAAGAASATTIGECQALITTLQGQTASAEFTGRNATKDENALIAKLGDAFAGRDQAATFFLTSGGQDLAGALLVLPRRRRHL